MKVSSSQKYLNQIKSPLKLKLYFLAKLPMALLAGINIKDINKLRLAEFSDRDILDIVEVTAYYAYANRIADGLGITKEDWITDK